MALNSTNRRVNWISKVPSLNRPACTAKTAQKPKVGTKIKWKSFVKSAGENLDSNVNKNPELPACKIVATAYNNNLITNSGVFDQILTINRNHTKVMLFCLKNILRNQVSCQRIFFLKGKNFEEQKKMPATLSKIAKFTVRLLEDGDVSDEELVQMETKTETTLDISMESISEEDLDGNINLNQYSRGNLRSSLNFSKLTNFSNFFENFPERRVEETFKSKTKSQWFLKKRIQIFIEFNIFLGTENFAKNRQNSSGRNGSNKKQRSNLIYGKIRISHTNKILHRKINCYLKQKLITFFAIKITDSIQIPSIEDILGAETEHEDDETEEEDEEREVEMTKVVRKRLDREPWKKKFPGGKPPFPVSTPEEDAYWAEWAETRDARLEQERQTETEGTQSEVDETERASSSASAKPAATPKEAGRCKEGDFCSDLMNHSCVYDTSSTVTMESEKSVQCRGLSREGEEMPDSFIPDPHFDFTLNDLNLQIGEPEVQENAPSIIWTEASVLSTLASVISTDPSIISTQPSVASTVPSVLIVEEVDLRYQCSCGTKIGLQERVATCEFAALYPAPYICYACRWAHVGL